MNESVNFYLYACGLLGGVSVRLRGDPPPGAGQISGVTRDCRGQAAYVRPALGSVVPSVTAGKQKESYGYESIEK